MRCCGELKTLRGTCDGVRGQCVLAIGAIFTMCGNESQPGLQLVEKLTTPLFWYNYCFSSLVEGPTFPNSTET